MVRRVEQTLLSSQLEYINSLPEVSAAYLKLQGGLSKVDFTITLPASIKEQLLDTLQLNLFNIEKVPCRWIQGDTAPHVDRASAQFENTYLVYLTSGEGEFMLGGESYPIVAGTGFSFSEGLSHSVVGTGGGARLLLGPMSEQGFAVGGLNIAADGATDTVYIADIAGTVCYKINDGDWTTVPFPCNVGNINGDPTNNILKVLFTTDITLTEWNQNFLCGTAGIQFGSATLNANGERPFIIIDNAPLYRGVILNGNSGGGGYDHIYVYNLRVSASGTSTLDDGTWSDGPGGWVGGAYFGIAASNNYIVNCSSDGPIGDRNGGVVGGYCGSSSGSLTIIGCSSSGTSTQLAGGIVGAYGGQNGSVTCEQCFTTGVIGDFAGGIFGDYAGDGGTAVATKCYTTGSIGVAIGNAGGIFGRYAGNAGTATAEKCYSRGDIAADGGGIFGLSAGSGGGTTTATNCYSAGSIATTGNGIYGTGKGLTSFTFNCYSANSNWNNGTANGSLQGVPGASGVGTTWISRGTNQPYELNAIGYTPYQLNNINSSSELIQSFSGTVQAGLTTPEAAMKNTDPSGNDFTILQITGGDSGSYTTITMSSQTGAISTTNATVPGTYTITLRSLGSYNITIYLLTLTAGGGGGGETVVTTACCQTETFTRDISYEWLNDYRIGRRLVAESAQNPKLRFYDYSEYVKYKMALGSGKI